MALHAEVEGGGLAGAVGHNAGIQVAILALHLAGKGFIAGTAFLAGDAMSRGTPIDCGGDQGTFEGPLSIGGHLDAPLKLENTSRN